MGTAMLVSLWQALFARTITTALALALLLATAGQSQADPEPKRIMMLHSFGLPSGRGLTIRKPFARS